MTIYQQQFIKHIFEAISEPLLHLINISFTEGIFPSKLKKANVKPIHKKGDKLNVNEYRPVALLVILSKVFEGVMSSRLRSFLTTNCILANEQFGFRKGSSTTDAIFDMTEFVTEALDGRENVITVLLDLTKAFDHVNHEVLLSIMERYGVRGIAYNWFQSYLKDRKQSVVLDILDKNKVLRKVETRTTNIKKGVTQGSILGPILFLLYVNHLPRIIKEKIIMFADDVSVFFKFNKNNPSDLSSTITSTITQIITWLQSLNLNTNVSKTNMLHFKNYNTSDISLDVRIDDKRVDCVKNAKFLGVHIDESLNWKKHIETLESRLSSFCYALRCLSRLATKKAAIEAYYAFFQSRVVYGLALWGGSTDVSKIFILQKRCVRILDNLESNRISCRDSFKNLKIHTLTALYVIELCKIIMRYPGKFPLRPEGESSRLNERYKYNLEIPKSRTKSYDRTTKMAAIKVFNKLPDDIKMLKGNKFLNRVKQFLLVISPYSLNEFLEFKCE